MKVIQFWGPDEVPYGLFSNFANTPLIIDGDSFPTAEHYFQAAKTNQSIDRKRIMEAPSPRLAKNLGRQVQLRADWEKVKDSIMKKVLREKAKQSKEFSDLLLSTGDAALVEASPFDYYWGKGRDGSGFNKLGQLLMELRSELASQK